MTNGRSIGIHDMIKALLYYRYYDYLVYNDAYGKEISLARLSIQQFNNFQEKQIRLLYDIISPILSLVFCISLVIVTFTLEMSLNAVETFRG